MPLRSTADLRVGSHLRLWVSCTRWTCACRVIELGLVEVLYGVEVFNALPRKEVIQPQLPLRLPCYDFVPVTGPTLGRYLLPKQVGPRTSGVVGSHDVTGGVYKARELIHRAVLTRGY